MPSGRASLEGAVGGRTDWFCLGCERVSAIFFSFFSFLSFFPFFLFFSFLAAFGRLLSADCEIPFYNLFGDFVHLMANRLGDVFTVGIHRGHEQYSPLAAEVEFSF